MNDGGCMSNNDHFFADMILDVFGFLRTDYNYEYLAFNAINVVFTSGDYSLRFERQNDGSGWMGMFVGMGKKEIMLANIAESLPGNLKFYAGDFYASDAKSARAGMENLANALKLHYPQIFLGDTEEFNRLHALSRDQRDKELEDMKYGGLRSRAIEAWDKKDYAVYIFHIRLVPSYARTDSEERRLRMAQIKTQ